MGYVAGTTRAIGVMRDRYLGSFASNWSNAEEIVYNQINGNSMSDSQGFYYYEGSAYACR